jgi:hypothetical protein
MALTDKGRRQSAGARRAGYCLAIGFSAALLIVLNGSPGWQAIPFLTSDTDQVLWLVNLSLAAGIAANVVYLAYDPPWVRSPGDLVTTGIGLATAIRIWQVFPFALSSGWSTAVRVLLVVAIAGSCIALVVQIISLARWFTGHTPAWQPRPHRTLISCGQSSGSEQRSPALERRHATDLPQPGHRISERTAASDRRLR